MNNFAENKNEDILIQYNEYYNFDKFNSSRLFYGFNKNGDYFFSRTSSYTNEFNINIDEEIIENNDFLNLYEIQDSKSLFVSIKNNATFSSKRCTNINNNYLYI